MAAQQAEMAENSESTSAKEQGNSTKKKSETGHSLDKKGKGGGLKDAFDQMLKKKSISEICREWNIHDSTFRKIYDRLKKKIEE